MPGMSSALGSDGGPQALPGKFLCAVSMHPAACTAWYSTHLHITCESVSPPSQLTPNRACLRRPGMGAALGSSRGPAQSMLSTV